MFTSVGGVESLFPLLEYAELPVRTFPQRKADSKKEKQAERATGEGEGDTAQDPAPPSVPPRPKPSSVSHFLSILKGMLSHSPVSMKMFDISNGSATLGCLLAKVRMCMPHCRHGAATNHTFITSRTNMSGAACMCTYVLV